LSDILDQKIVTIRRDHYCWGCGIVHPAGTRMEFIKSVDSGHFMRNYWCSVCQEYWKRHMQYGDEISAGELLSGDPEGWNRIKVELETSKLNT